MKRWSIRIAIALVLFGALARANSNLRLSAGPLADLQQTRSLVRSLLQSPDPHLGREKGSGANSRNGPSGALHYWLLTPFPAAEVTGIEFQRFDPGAVVLIRPGRDGQPGVARVDDDRNGTVDDRSELGATHSDDVCSVEPAADPEDESTLILQYGAFVPTSPDQADGETPQPMRAVVFGESAAGERWSFLVELDRGVRSGE